MKLFAFTLLCCVFLSSSAFAQTKVIKVRTSQEFIQAIGSDTHIMMEAGLYNLSKFQGVQTDFLTWGDTYDGDEPTFVR